METPTIRGKLFIGSTGNDLIDGTPGNDRIRGNAGNDFIWAHEGDDGIAGGDGNDMIVGGKGNDILTGGAGKDIFYWLRGDLGGTDRVRDFHLGEDAVAFNGVTIDDLSLASEGENTIISVHGPQGEVLQQVVLEGFTLSGDAPASTKLQWLVDQNAIQFGNITEQDDANSDGDTAECDPDFIVVPDQVAVYGNAQQDEDNVIAATAENERLRGSDGPDLFTWRNADLGGTDHIEDFNPEEDRLQLPVNDAYRLGLSTDGQNTVVSYCRQEAPTDDHQYVTLQQVDLLGPESEADALSRLLDRGMIQLV